MSDTLPKMSSPGRNQETPKQLEKKGNIIMKNRSSLTLFITIMSVIGSLALLPEVKGAPEVAPAPDGCYPNFTTAEGCKALNSLTTGSGNTGLGWYALFGDSTNSFNTGVGAGALVLNNADSNTAVGTVALLLNNTGSENTAVGANALLNNSVASENNAVGAFALYSNDSSGNGTANFNNAHGRNALFNNVDGDENDAFGDDAMESNTTGIENTAMGDDALDGNTTGAGNTAVGKEAGNSIVDGVDNVVVGHNAGIGIVHGQRQIAIGSAAAGQFADSHDTCFIGSIFNQPTGDPGSTVAVFIDSNNNLGTISSSRRYKHDIQPMDKASEVILALKPVTFKYNSDVKGTSCFGLIAEDVAQADRNLVVRDKNGEVQTVRYEQINAMLLNEFLKEHKKVEEQQTSICQLKSEMQTMVAQLKEQAAQIQKVSARLEVNKAAPQTVANK